MSNDNTLYIDDASASRALDWSMSIFFCIGPFWFCVQAFKGFTF